MSLASGREFLSIPGPTVIPDAVLAAMQRPAASDMGDLVPVKYPEACLAPFGALSDQSN